MIDHFLTKRRLLWITHVGALMPLAWLLWDNYAGNLSVNPIQDITFRTGKPALVLLVLTLACTPLHTVFGWRSVLAARKWLGLYGYGYALAHFLVFIGLDYVFDWSLIYEAVFEKRYALVGFAALLILTPLALTSTKGWMRRLGRRWKRLHQAIYAAALLATFHYIWLVKSDIREPLAWTGLVVLLLILRIPFVRRWVVALRAREWARPFAKHPLAGEKAKG